MEAIVLFQGQQLGPVQFWSLHRHRSEDLELFLRRSSERSQLNIAPPLACSPPPVRSPSKRAWSLRPRVLGEGVPQGGPAGPQPRRSLTGAPGSAALAAREVGVPGSTAWDRERALPCSWDQAQPRLHPATKAGERKISAGRESCDLGKKSNLQLKCQMPGPPVVSPSPSHFGLSKLRDASNLFPPAPEALRRRRRCQPADSSASAAAARSPRRGFKCQPCRKPARGGSPPSTALALPCGPGGEKLSRAPPCLWAVAPLGTRDRSLHGKGGC